MGLWYSKDVEFELIAYSDADHAGCKDDCKSTSEGSQLLSEKLVSGNGYQEKDKIKTKLDKTGHENGKSTRNRSRRQIYLKSNPVKPLT
ncbi:hypothetical protein Tco_1475836 [Tanacetum coccineum]